MGQIAGHDTPTMPPLAMGDGGEIRISPTDVSQFIRLEQCERYLRLRLHERAHGAAFQRDFGVAPQSIPPLLTRSGERFEAVVSRDAAARFPTRDLATGPPPRGRQETDNGRVVAAARDLASGGVLLLFQPRLEVALGGWRLRGDLDILRLERDGEGSLRVLIADMKSSTSARVEHRLQVAFYHEMLAALLREAGVATAEMRMGILYRGPDADERGVGDEERALQEAQRDAAERLFGTRAGLLEPVGDPDGYLGAVADLVTGPASTAARVAAADFAALPAHLTYKCDGCLYNEFCMKWSAERDDLSLLPHLTGQDKGALLGAGVATVRAVAELKVRQPGEGGEAGTALRPAPGREDLVRRLSATWPVGPRLDELVHRAQRYRRSKGDDFPALPYIPHRGYGSLPYADAAQNPNLVRVYIDAQHDYLSDRIYMLGSLVVASEGGEEPVARRRSVVHLSEGPPEGAEREAALFVAWITETLAAIVGLAAPDALGEPCAPIHLIFYNEFGQRLLLEGLGRHLTRILGATPLYDFLTQLAAFDSPVATFLEAEIRTLKNYPMVCQSLQSVAGYLGFDWAQPDPYRELFRERLFDGTGVLDRDAAGEPAGWYSRRARFNSQIPLEYAYAAWGELAAPDPRERDAFAPYRAATPPLLRGFYARRLEALERIAKDFKGNSQTEKTPFRLPDLAAFVSRARTLAQALDEFVLIERHVALGEWKRIRLASPEQRLLSGDTLIGRYRAADQPPDVAALNGEHLAKQLRAEALKRDHGELSEEERKDTKWSQQGLRISLALDCAEADCTLDAALSLTTLRAGDRVVVLPRTMTDSRLPEAGQLPQTPTPKRMLYGTRATVLSIVVGRDGAGKPTEAGVELQMERGNGGSWSRGFAFSAMDLPFAEGARYTLDEDPTNWAGYQGAMVTQALCQGGTHALYERLVDPAAARVRWPDAAREGQGRFLAGLDAFQRAGLLNPFEPGKRAFIGGHGEAPLLLVQGSPGTGKSYTTAFAVLARLQGAMAADQDCRAFLSCKTHAATDVLLEKLARALEDLRAIRARHPELFDTYIDARLPEVPLFRVAGRKAPPAGVTPLPRKEDRPKGVPTSVKRVEAHRWCAVACTPGGVYGMVKERWGSGGLLGHELCDCLVLDEASQMNLPEALLAALLLRPGGQVVVVGDPRQMPPIVQHDWANEMRRTFGEYRTYESLFDTLLALRPAMVKFEESFRLHADMAEFLRREIYQQDGIPYFSRRTQRLPPPPAGLDPFVAAVLAPEHPIVVVVHDEAGSQLSNPFERGLLAPVLTALADPATYNLGPEHGLGVVVPHRAQRAALQDLLPCLTRLDTATGAIAISAVDTVERFQGDEREVILISATESDREYLQLAGAFLLDPRRLTVALSRAKHKLVLVASRSVFSLFSTDEETFGHVQLWKNLLRRTCMTRIWEGERDGRRVTVWGNAAATAPAGSPLEPAPATQAVNAAPTRSHPDGDRSGTMRENVVGYGGTSDMGEHGGALDRRIGEALARVEHSRNRLVLAITDGSAAELDSLRISAQLHDLHAINLNLSLSQRLLECPAGRRTPMASDMLRDVVEAAGSGGILLFNTELLFDASLKLNPLRSLLMLARERTVVATWNGSLDGTWLVYATPDHPDYRRVAAEECICIRTSDGPDAP